MKTTLFAIAVIILCSTPAFSQKKGSDQATSFKKTGSTATASNKGVAIDLTNAADGFVELQTYECALTNVPGLKKSEEILEAFKVSLNAFDAKIDKVVYSYGICNFSISFNKTPDENSFKNACIQSGISFVKRKSNYKPVTL